MGNQPSNPSSPPRSPEEILQEGVCGPDCQKQKDIANAFSAYQAASSNKEADPETYAWAKFQYLSTKNGPEWTAQEKQRLVKTQIDPLLKQYQQKFISVEGEYAKQRELVDVVEAVEAKQSQMKSSLQSQMSEMDAAIDEKRSKIGVWNRMIELTSGATAVGEPTTTNRLIAYFSDYPASFSTILDVVIAVMIFFVGVIVWRKARAQTDALRRSGFLPFMAYSSAPVPASGPPPGSAAAAILASTASGTGIVGRSIGFVRDYFPFFFVLLATIGIILAIIYGRPSE
jgi:hypothetical protein